jgi:hypothetical protein
MRGPHVSAVGVREAALEAEPAAVPAAAATVQPDSLTVPLRRCLY